MSKRRKYSETTRAGQIADAETDLRIARERLASLPSAQEDDDPVTANRRWRAERAVELLAGEVASLKAGRGID